MQELTNEEIIQSVELYDPNLSVENYNDISGRARRTYLIELENSENLVGYYCVKKSNEEKFKKEEGLLEMVSQKTTVPTQEIIHSDLSKNKISYLFYLAREIQGYDPQNRYKYLPRKFKKRYVRQIAKKLAELHSRVQFKEAGGFRLRDGEIRVLNGGTWKEFLQQKVMERINDFDKRFSDLEKNAEEFLKKNIDLVGGEKPCLVHYDVKPDNTIVRDDELEAIVDWEKSICGDRVWDLAYSRFHLIDRWFETESIRRELEKEYLEAYLQEIKLREGWRKRLKYYGVLQIFDGMHAFSNFTEDQGMSEKDKNQMERSMREIFSQNNHKIEEAKNEFAV